MMNGWKPKRNAKINTNNVFTLNYAQTDVDEVIKELYRHQNKYSKRLIYLGKDFVM